MPGTLIIGKSIPLVVVVVVVGGSEANERCHTLQITLSVSVTLSLLRCPLYKNTSGFKEQILIERKSTRAFGRATTVDCGKKKQMNETHLIPIDIFVATLRASRHTAVPGHN